MFLAMLTIEKAMHARIWFCSYSYGALVDSRLARQRSASKEIVVNNKHKLRLSFFFQMVYHKCDIYKKRFLRPAHRDRHMRTHTGEKPFFLPSMWEKVFSPAFVNPACRDTWKKEVFINNLTLDITLH